MYSSFVPPHYPQKWIKYDEQKPLNWRNNCKYFRSLATIKQSYDFAENKISL